MVFALSTNGAKEAAKERGKKNRIIRQIRGRDPSPEVMRADKR